MPGGIFLFDVAGVDRAPRAGRQRTFAEGPDWAVLVETQSDTERAGLTRHITSFRRVGARFRRDAEVHRLTLLDPAALLTSLSDAGFRAESMDRYGPPRRPAESPRFSVANLAVRRTLMTKDCAMARALGTASAPGVAS